MRLCSSQDRLDNLTLLIVEYEITKTILNNDIIDEFARDPRKK